MDRRYPGRLVVVAVIALVAGACGGSAPSSTQIPITAAPAGVASLSPSVPVTEATTTPEPTAGTAQAPTSTPTPAPTPAQTPTPAPTPTQTPDGGPNPTPAPLAAFVQAKGWSAPHQVGTRKDCNTLSAAIAAGGRYIIAAECAGSIDTYISTSHAIWTSTVFTHPAHRADLDPRVVVDGSVVYVAYSRIDPDGGCGSLGTDVGVYYRSRQLPSGAWSAATKIGAVSDTLVAFSVADGRIHAVVGNAGQLFYELVDGSTSHRYEIPNAINRASLAVGADGRARIAYEVGGGLRYAIFTGTGFKTSRVVGSIGRDWAPVLALGAGAKPELVWTRSPEPGGCAGPGPSPLDGTYYAVKTNGTWSSGRITTDTGEASLEVDAVTGRVRVLLSGEHGLRYYTTGVDGGWARTTIAPTRWAMSPVLCRDVATGTLFVVYLDASANGSNHIEALTKT
jgi:hypothetical protein